MLHSHEYERSCQDAGKNSKKYEERIGFLKSKWKGNPEDDSEAMRLISSVIYRPTLPIIKNRTSIPDSAFAWTEPKTARAIFKLSLPTAQF